MIRDLRLDGVGRCPVDDSLAEDASEAGQGARGHRADGIGRDVVVPAVVPVHLVRAVADEGVDGRGPPLLLPVRLDALADREGVARLRLLALLRRGRRAERILNPIFKLSEGDLETRGSRVLSGLKLTILSTC